MSDAGAFCPQCGEPVGEEALSDDGVSRCLDCYFEDFELVDLPERIEVLVCNECGAVRRGERWVDVEARDYVDVAVDAVTEEVAVHVDAEEVAWTVEPEQLDATTVEVTARFSAMVRGRPVETERTVAVKLARGTCDRCGRIAGDYYAATVQVRAAGRTPTDEERRRAEEIARTYVADREAEGDREAFISEIGTTDAGLDVKVSTSGIGRAVADRIVRELGGTVGESQRLITEEDGQEVYRMAYSVRLPEFVPGDVIGVDDGGPVLVRSVKGNLKGLRLTTGERYEADAEDGIAPDADRLGTVADAAETTLVAVEDERAVQVLDPETYETKTISRPDYLDPDAETVRVLKSRAGLHILPEDA